MKTLNLGVSKYKNPTTGQFESLPCLKGDKGESTHTHDNKDVLDSITGIVTKEKYDSNNNANPPTTYNESDLINYNLFDTLTSEYYSELTSYIEETSLNITMQVKLTKNGDTYTIDKTVDDISNYVVNFGPNPIFITIVDDPDNKIYNNAKFFKHEVKSGVGRILYFRAWLSETELIDISITLSSDPGTDGSSIPPVTVEKKTIVPSTLPNPNKLTFEGAVTAEYDGSGAVTINIPDESSTARVEKTAADTVVELESNKLYIFPEMASLTYTLATPADAAVANEYHFIFQSGATATQLVNPAGVSVPDGMTIDSNKVYEISILEGCLAYQSWEVTDA